MPQRDGQRGEEIAAVRRSAHGGEIARRHLTRPRIEVGGVNLHAWNEGRGGQTQRPGSAAQIDERVAGREPLDRRADQEFAASARNEHTGFDDGADRAQLDPADHRLEWLTRASAYHHRLEVIGARRLGAEQGRLVLGVDAPGRAQARHEHVVAAGLGTVDSHGPTVVRRARSEWDHEDAGPVRQGGSRDVGVFARFGP